jgi:hypothetical protein
LASLAIFSETALASETKAQKLVEFRVLPHTSSAQTRGDCPALPRCSRHTTSGTNHEDADRSNKIGLPGVGSAAEHFIETSVGYSLGCGEFTYEVLPSRNPDE